MTRAIRASVRVRADMLRCAACALVCLLPCSAAPALAQEVRPRAAEQTSAPTGKPWTQWLDREGAPLEPPETRETWYGWQTLLLDAGGTTALLLTAGDDGAIVSLGVLLIGPPFVHLAHANYIEAALSLCTRGLAAAALIAGSSSGLETDFTPAPSGREDLGNTLLGMLLLLTASILDAAQFAWHPHPVQGPEARASLVPILDPANERAGLRYVSSF